MNTPIVVYCINAASVVTVILTKGITTSTSGDTQMTNPSSVNNVENVSST